MALSKIIKKAEEIAKPEKILIDTSPFFGGATHLAWCAAEALIISVEQVLHLNRVMYEASFSQVYGHSREILSALQA